MAKTGVVTPGERIGETTSHRAGTGVVANGTGLFSALVGQVVSEATNEMSDVPHAADRRTVLRVVSARDADGAPPMPEIGAVVTAKITKVTPRAAHAEILVVGGRPLRELFKGTIRQQDVRQTEIDKVEIYKCFAPGDVVLAEVISLGDRHSYFLTTAKNELGVVYAKSIAGVAMLPVSWQEMQCPTTKVREFRKVAKVDTVVSSQHV